MWREVLGAAPYAEFRTESAIRAEARREAFAEAEAQHLANREGYEAFCRAIGMEPDCHEVIAHQMNAKIARVRREALEEAVKAAAECDGPYNCPTDEQYYAVDLMADRIAAAIRDLIGKEPA
jgi:hypothetical protein